MMKIDHIAIWVEDLEQMKDFYIKYFGLESNELYTNPLKGFSSYFLSFANGMRIELMHRADIYPPLDGRDYQQGWAHIAIALGDKTRVDQLTERLRKDGYTIHSEPRTTGDGYYESVIEDPEGNLVEITV